jgi:hypothetical protein
MSQYLIKYSDNFYYNPSLLPSTLTYTLHWSLFCVIKTIFWDMMQCSLVEVYDHYMPNLVFEPEDRGSTFLQNPEGSILHLYCLS